MIFFEFERLWCQFYGFGAGLGGMSRVVSFVTKSLTDQFFCSIWALPGIIMFLIVAPIKLF